MLLSRNQWVSFFFHVLYIYSSFTRMYSKSVAILRYDMKKKELNAFGLFFTSTSWGRRQSCAFCSSNPPQQWKKKERKGIDVVGLFVFIFSIHHWNMCFTNENIIQAMQTWKQLVFFLSCRNGWLESLKDLREHERIAMLLEVREFSVLQS